VVGEAGWVVPPRNPEALAGALRAAIDAWHDEAAFARRRVASRERVAARFGLVEMIRGFRQAWGGADV
jgi:hypothetical protein